MDQRSAEAMTGRKSNEPSRQRGAPSLDEARLRQQAIGVKLRDMFNAVVNEPVPDEFLEILRRTDSKTGTE